MLKITDLQKTFNPGTVNAKIALSGLDLILNDGDFSVQFFFEFI